MSGGQIGTAVGFVAGFFLPGGPQVWAGIGGMVGGLIDPEVIQGPKIGEITQQTAAEGGPRPIVFGRSQPMTGNIIADSEPRIVKTKESAGKGGPKVEKESAYRTYAVGVCEGPITAFLQVWRNGTLVYDIEDQGMSADNAEFLKYARFYLGTFDQMPSPDLEAVKGAGNVHGHRGTVYMVLADEDVTEQRGMWSQWQFRVARFSGQEPGLWWTVRTPEGSDPIPADREIWRTPSMLSVGVPEERGPPNVQLAKPDYTPTYVVRTPSGAVIIHGVGTTYERYVNYTATDLPPPTLHTITESDVEILRIRSFENCLVATCFDSNSYYVSTDEINWQEYTAPDGLLISEVARLSSGRWVSAGGNGPDITPLYWDGEIPVAFERASFEAPAYLPYKNAIIAIGDSAFTVNPTGEVLRTNGGGFWFATGLQTGFSQARSGWYANGAMVFSDVNNNNIAISYSDGSTFSIEDLGRGIGRADYGNGEWVLSGSPANNNVLVSTNNLASFQESVVDDDESKSYFSIFTDPPFSYADSFYPLPLLIQELSARVGNEVNIDVSLLDGYHVRGLTITNTYPCSKVLESLSKFFFFMPSNVSGKTRFVPFGDDTVATITEDDLVDNDREIDEEFRRGDTISIAPLLHLNYFDVRGGLNTDKQTSERPRNGRATGEQSMETPVSSDADEAATVVAKIHAMQVEQQRGELSFSLPDNWLFLTESDPVFLQWEGKTVRGVITQVDTQDGYQDYKAIRDRQSIHTMQVEGHPPAPATRPPSRVVGPTMIEFLDIPILRDSDDRLGYYIAVTGMFPAWRGAQIELSVDGGENYIDSAQVTAESTMGALIAPLGDHPQAYPDEVNSFQVSLNTPDAELQATTLTGMMNRQNLAMVGDEMICFADVDEVSEGVWDISYLLRGRKGTETEAHEVGERFVMLDNVFFVPADLTLLDKTLTFRAISFGTGAQDATIISATFTGQSQTERQPAYLQAHRSGSDVVASWQGVGRLGGGVHVAMGSYFAGYRVTITDGSTTETHNTSDESITASLSAFTGPVTVSVQQRNQLTGLGPAIEVIV